MNNAIKVVCFVIMYCASFGAQTTPAKETPAKVIEEEVFKFVERMPLFPGCNDMKMADTEKTQCSKDKLISYIIGKLKYPEDARKNKVQGDVVVQFVVEKDGSVSNVKVVKDICTGCGEAVATAINSMNSLPEKWTPGNQRNKPVRVLYTVPVKFQIDR